MRNSSIELTELFKYGNILGFPRLHSTTAYVCIRKISHSPYVMLITIRIQYDSLLDSMDMNRYLVEASRQRRNKPPPDSSAIEVRRDQLDTAFALYSIRTKLYLNYVVDKAFRLGGTKSQEFVDTYSI